MIHTGRKTSLFVLTPGAPYINNQGQLALSGPILVEDAGQNRGGQTYSEQEIMAILEKTGIFNIRCTSFQRAHELRHNYGTDTLHNEE